MLFIGLKRFEPHGLRSISLSNEIRWVAARKFWRQASEAAQRWDHKKLLKKPENGQGEHRLVGFKRLKV
jgi:hypothetical protein